MLGCCFTDVFNRHINVDGEYDMELLYIFLLESHVWCHSNVDCTM
jgi:hypothetical protein